MRLENQTPFLLAHSVFLDKHGAEHLVVALKATFAISDAGRLDLAKKQDPIRPAEEFHGEPDCSSVRYEAELGPPKLATDVALLGSALAPRSGVTQMDVSLRVGPLFKQVRVFGDRQWRRSLVGYSISAPAPFQRIPLRYEHAYGGTDTSPKRPSDHAWEARNPVGRGFRAKASQLDFAGMPLPNIEDPQGLLGRPGGKVVPQGFSFIGRNWEPRVQFIGTYDQKWQETRMPLLPLNFDDRHYNAAHPDLVAAGFLSGSLPVEVTGCTSSGRLSFSLPVIRPSAGVVFRTGHEPLAMNLNTIAVNTEVMTLTLLWKGALNVHLRLGRVVAVECRAASG